MPKPILIAHPITGERMSLKDLSRSTGINAVTLARRYHRGIRGLSLIDKTLLTGPRAKPQKESVKAALCRTSQALTVRDMADIGHVWMMGNTPFTANEAGRHR